MNLGQLQAFIQKLSDQQLAQEMKSPSGIAPLEMISMEMKRRARMRGSMVPTVKAFSHGGEVHGGTATQRYDDYFKGALGEIGRYMGIGGDPLTLQTARTQVEQMMPDRVSPELQQLISEAQADREERRRSNRGRALMEAGFAMMQSKSPTFWGALGEGGQAGLEASEEHRAQDREMALAERQARLARANALASRDSSLLGAASNIFSADRTGRASVLQGAASMAGDRSRIDLSEEEMAHQSRENALNRANSLAAARIARGQDRDVPMDALVREGMEMNRSILEREPPRNILGDPTAMARWKRDQYQEWIRSGEHYANAILAARGVPMRDRQRLMRRGAVYQVPGGNGATGVYDGPGPDGEPKWQPTR
jgi:hypothetical protein